MQETVKRVLTGDFDKKKGLWLLLTALLTLIVWNLPSAAFGIEGLTIVQQRVIAIFVMAVMLWLTEAIPVLSSFFYFSSAIPHLNSCRVKAETMVFSSIL